MNVKDTLFQYSEWLDVEGLMVGSEASGDDRSHDDLVDAFLGQMKFVEAVGDTHEVKADGKVVRIVDGFEALNLPRPLNLGIRRESHE